MKSLLILYFLILYFSEKFSTRVHMRKRDNNIHMCRYAPCFSSHHFYLIKIALQNIYIHVFYFSSISLDILLQLARDYCRREPVGNGKSGRIFLSRWRYTNRQRNRRRSKRQRSHRYLIKHSRHMVQIPKKEYGERNTSILLPPTSMCICFYN